MSKIKELIQSRINELAILELQEQDHSLQNPEMMTISIRMSRDSVKKLDLIADKLQLSRSDIVRTFLESGASEALQALDVPVSEVVDFLETYEQKEVDSLLEGENK